MDNKTFAKAFKILGIKPNESAKNVIAECDSWYRGDEEKFHKRTNLNNVDIKLDTMNFAKRGCADDANLCEVVEINTGNSTDRVKEVLDSNNFLVMFRKQLEETSATGTVGAYWYLKDALYEGERVVGGTPAINFVMSAEQIIPITVDNERVTECAFCGSSLIDGKEVGVVVAFRKDGERYYSDTVVIDDKKLLDTVRMELGDVCPFALLKTAQVNNIKDMSGYGLPKIKEAIPVLKCLDLAYNILFGDLDKGEKLVFINELLSCIGVAQDGTPMLTPEQRKTFVLLGEKLPEANTLIHEYNPEIRIEEITKVFETLLSLFSMMFGFGTKKYTFENGQIKTASEYIGEKQDCMQEVNKQRGETTKYIIDLLHGLTWFYEAFGGESIATDDINIDYDDSYIEDKGAKLERVRADAMAFEIPELLVWYIMDAYNLDEAEARKLVIKNQEEKDQEELDDSNLNENE